MIMSETVVQMRREVSAGFCLMLVMVTIQKMKIAQYVKRDNAAVFSMSPSGAIKFSAPEKRSAIRDKKNKETIMTNFIVLIVFARNSVGV